MNKPAVIKAVKDLFIAMDTIPPDDVIKTMSDLLGSNETSAIINKAALEMQQQYIDIGVQIKNTIDQYIKTYT